MIKKLLGILILASFIFSYAGCNEDFSQEEIPPASFQDIFINLDLPQYNDLSIDGGYFLINDKGLRGIIIYRVSATQYNAFERNCSYQPFNACATVEVHSSELFLHDPCCGSNFSFNQGDPIGGPAQTPLRRYSASLSGRSLVITDDPI